MEDINADIGNAMLLAVVRILVPPSGDGTGKTHDGEAQSIRQALSYERNDYDNVSSC